MGELKLYVVGERSPNPDEWDGGVSWALVIARDADEAGRLAPEAVGLPLEVAFDKPKVLIRRTGDGGWPEDDY
jgi:hypothetical protein